MSPIPRYNEPASEHPVASAGRRRHPSLWLILVAALVVAVVAAGVVFWTQRPSAFEKNDPNGYAACQQLIKARDAGASARERVGALLQAGSLAERANTTEISDASVTLGLGGASIAKVKKLKVACEGAGVDIPNAQ